MDKDILAFVSHKATCSHLLPMWHKGPCNCGLYILLDKLRSTGLSADVRSTISLLTLYSLWEVCPKLMADWTVANKRRMPDELYMCRKCSYTIAEKQPDNQGWDGYCYNCGMIAQGQVGELVFSKPESVR